MNLNQIEEKITKNIEKKAELELEKLKREKADKEVELLNKERDRQEKEAQRLYELDLRKRQRQRDEIEYSKTPESRTRRASKEAEEIRDRDINRGLTKEERDYKNMDSKTRLECRNAIAQGDVKNITGFIKKKRLEQERSDRNKKRLKGL